MKKICLLIVLLIALTAVGCQTAPTRSATTETPLALTDAATAAATVTKEAETTCETNATTEKTNGGASETLRFTDALGKEISMTQSPARVAAISGSFAETWLLAGGTLAALTEDAYSERGIEADKEVACLGAMKSPDVEQMIQLGIDFAILSSKITEHVKLRDTLEKAGIQTAYFEVESFSDYLDMLKICSTITGRPDLYEKNGLAVQEKITRAIEKKEGHTPPTVLFIRAFSSGAKAKGSDNMTGVMLKDLGCVNIADRNNQLLEDLSMEQIILDDPDFIFVACMGASEKAALDNLAAGIQANPAWNELTAVKEGRYIVLPRNLFHYKPNARWNESYEMLAEMLYGS